MRRYLVAAAMTKTGVPNPVLSNHVVSLEADEVFNALAVKQVQDLLKEEFSAEEVALLTFQPLETSPGQVATLYPPRADMIAAWMSANEYCTDNEIEGDANAIDLLLRDHALLKTERDHLNGLLQMAVNTLSFVRSDMGVPTYLQEDVTNVLAAQKNIRKHLTEMRAEVTERPSFEETCYFDPAPLGPSS